MSRCTLAEVRHPQMPGFAEPAIESLHAIERNRAVDAAVFKPPRDFPLLGR
jgi:hypothetical protein